MDIAAPPIRTYRWVVVVLAASFLFYSNVIWVLETNMTWHAGGPFRFLTLWAITLSLISGSLMLRASYRHHRPGYEVVAMCSSVLNVMVVCLYWRLYLQNPGEVDYRAHVPAFEELYMHGLGPALQVFDAVFICRAFRRVRRAVLPILLLILAYVLWIELYIHPRGIKPVGTVTHGLPYRFLDSMDLTERLITYGVYAVFALLVLAALGGVGALLMRRTQGN